MQTNRNLTVLFFCQALYWGAVITGITLSALVGASLAPQPLFATLPAGLLTVGAILVTAPVSMLMQRYGRMFGFRIGTVCGTLGGILCAYAIIEQSFVLFCLGNFSLGVYQACANYYRLAATDSAPPEGRGRAIAWVMAGGVLAALISPSLSVWSKDMVADALYAGSYIIVVVLGVLATALLGLLRAPQSEELAAMSAEHDAGEKRTLGEIVRQPVFIAAVANAGVSHGTMILVMTTTPLAMVYHTHLMEDAATVIQWHVFGMFLPAFFSGRLVDKLGPAVVSIVGAVVFACSIATASFGTEFFNFLISSLLLGVGWNLMYVAGTTLIARSHTVAERGRVQGMAELGIATIAALSAFSSGALLAFFGWTEVNLGALPLLLFAVVITLWYARNGQGESV